MSRASARCGCSTATGAWWRRWSTRPTGAIRQYAGRLGFEDQLRHVLQGVGVSGRCIDYVSQTVAHLEEMDIRDAALEALAVAIGSSK